MSLPTLPQGLGRPAGGLKGILSGKRILSVIPRLKNNSMLMTQFMPNTMDVVSNIQATKGTTALVPLCLSVGAPRKTLGGLNVPALPNGGGLGGGLAGGLAVAVPLSRYSVWGLFDADMEPQMFVTVKEYSATVGTTLSKFVDVEFAKTKADPMEVTVYPDDPAKVQAASMPNPAGYAVLTWEIQPAL